MWVVAFHDAHFILNPLEPFTQILLQRLFHSFPLR